MEDIVTFVDKLTLLNHYVNKSTPPGGVISPNYKLISVPFLPSSSSVSPNYIRESYPKLSAYLLLGGNLSQVKSFEELSGDLSVGIKKGD